MLLVLAAVCGVYANHFQNGFHFDDAHTVLDNPYIRDLKNLPRFFTDPTTFSVLPANRTWRPFVSVSLALDYALGHGYQPFWFHFSTFLVYLSQLVLMFRLYSAILTRASPESTARNRLCALFAVAWYGLHPAIAETVNYVIQRGDIYSAFGVVFALALYARSPVSRKSHLYLLPFAFGLLSKPPALVFPALLFAYVYLFEEAGNSGRARRALARVVPSLVLCGALLWLQARMTPKTFAPSIIAPWSYRITQPYVWLRYVGSLFLPIHLNADTDLKPFEAIDARLIIGIFFVLILILLAWVTAQRRSLRPVSFGLLWFMLAQLPTSLYALSEVENDHRMYLGFIGLVLSASWAIALTLHRVLLNAREPARNLRARRLITATCFVILALYSFGTVARNRVWRDEESLWKDDVQKSPHNGRGLMNYGLVLMGKGDGQGALELFTRALVETPNYATLEVNLGIVNDLLGRTAESERHFLRALALTPQSDESHFYYGRSLFEHRRLAEAKAQLEAAISLNPARLEPQHLLMELELAQGNESAAQAVATGVLLLARDDEEAKEVLAHPAARTAAYWLELSLRQYQQQQYEECIASARNALALEPNLAEAYNNLAAAAAAEKKWDEAIAAAKQALRLKPDFPLARNNLAWAQSEKESAAHARR